MHNLIIFASGGGSNAAAVIRYFRSHTAVRVSLIVTNNPSAGVLKVASEAGIATLVIGRGDAASSAFISRIADFNPAFIVLAGYLWKVPVALVQAFPGKIVNIHPALLPAWGGKGMHGHHVHEAVIANKAHESGITIHYVNENYDEGNIIVQAHCPIFSSDTPETLAARVLKLEHFFYPRTIEFLLNS